MGLGGPAHQRALRHPHLPERDVRLRHRHPRLAALLPLRRRLGRHQEVHQPLQRLRPGRLAAGVQPHAQRSACATTSTPTATTPTSTTRWSRTGASATPTTTSRASASPGTSPVTAATSCAAASAASPAAILLVPAFTELQQNGDHGPHPLHPRQRGPLLVPLPGARHHRPRRVPRGLPGPRPGEPDDDRHPAARPRSRSSTRRSVNPYADQATLGWTDAARRLEPLPRHRGDLRQGARRDLRPRQELERQRHARPSEHQPATRSTPTPTTATPSTRRSSSASTARSRAATSSRPRSRSPTRRTSPTTSAPSSRTGYPNDPANLEGEWGRAAFGRALRVVVSGVFRLPWDLTVAPIAEYGSGQPWTHRLGYDYNGDGKNSDRARRRRAQRRGRPPFRQLSLRLTKAFTLRAARATRGHRRGVQHLQHRQLRRQLDRTAAQYLSGPTLTNPTAAVRGEPALRQVLRDAARPRRSSSGCGWSF